jgi:hypothetical protein
MLLRAVCQGMTDHYQQTFIINCMKTNIRSKKFCLVVVTSVVMALAVSGCSDDEEKATTKAGHNPFDHSHDVVVTDVQKHTFEHEFAEECVNREIKNSVNKDVDRARYTEPCMCIATFLMKDLTADEAKKFMVEHKNTQSLVIKYESAAYHCLQEKVPPKEPQLFGRQ